MSDNTDEPPLDPAAELEAETRRRLRDPWFSVGVGTVTGATAPDPTVMGEPGYGDPPNPNTNTTHDVYHLPRYEPPRWPDLPDAPVSEVGLLARRWLKDGDWSAVRPLLDALAEAGRDADRRAVLRVLGESAAQLQGASPRLHCARQVIALLWHDLFDLTGTLALLERTRPLTWGGDS